MHLAFLCFYLSVFLSLTPLVAGGWLSRAPKMLLTVRIGMEANRAAIVWND
jgi:hypothetical protein